MKVAFVVQRYGTEVVGGAEHICRQVAERLQGRVDIEIVTTCALDYRSWADHYAPGPQVVNGVPVRRFRVDESRDVRVFDQTSVQALQQPHNKALLRRWMREQGPHSTGLVEHLQTHHGYDVVVFFTYLYATTYFGLEHAVAPAVLVPFAHEEQWIHLPLFQEMFQRPRAFIFQTEEERDLVQRLFSVSNTLHVLAGSGIDAPQQAPDAASFWSQFRDTPLRAEDPLLVYLGRVDPSKGCDELIEYFRQFQRDCPELHAQLALIGPHSMDVPSVPGLVALGPILGDKRFDALVAANIVINPSPHESLSLMLLESWYVGRPVLVNGRCDVLRGQCLRSNGGLYYETYEEFREASRLLLTRPSLTDTLGQQGKQYMLAHHDWVMVTERYLAAMRQAAASGVLSCA